MLEAGAVGKKAAVDRGDFCKGVPALTVIVDGGWSKRSHKHTYNVLGGVAIIIGKHSGKLLHVGICNKYCSTCSSAASMSTDLHVHNCYKDWYESSQAMELDIITEGFNLSEKVHGLRFTRKIAEGNRKVYFDLKNNIPYGRHIEKIHCANHLCKNLRPNL